MKLTKELIEEHFHKPSYFLKRRYSKIVSDCYINKKGQIIEDSDFCSIEISLASYRALVDIENREKK